MRQRQAAASVALALAALLLLARTCAEQTRVTPSVQTYRVYIPIVYRPPGLWGKGVASTANGAYLDTLNADWFYTWSFCTAPNCIPMMRSAQLPPNCPPAMLYLNEPNSIEPYGATTSPELAARMSQDIRKMCPNTWLVAGNVAHIWYGMDGNEWIARYLAAGGIADQIGAHAYISANGNISQAMWIDELKVYGIPICVTEVGSAHDDMAMFEAALQYAAQFGCLAVFTDKSAPSPDYPDLNMINEDNERTPRGDTFEKFEVGQ